MNSGLFVCLATFVEGEGHAFTYEHSVIYEDHAN
jgi:hypothetical protein